MTDEPILRATGLQKYFPVTKGAILKRTIGQVKAVDAVDLDVYPGETVGLVGESGSGKSTAGRTMLRLLDPTGGKIEFQGQDITHLTRRELVPLRRQMQMIFQDPYSSLNPRHTVGGIISQPFQIQKVDPPGGQKKAVQDLMARVGLNPEHFNRYPNEFSGGQRQRIGVARAMALQPKLVIADEPVSALDVSVQAQVVNLLDDLQNEFGLAYIFIAHDLSVVRHISDRVAVMYLGHIVEYTPADELYARPRHPYTVALLSAVPIPDPELEGKRKRMLLSGDLPSPINPPSGCVFRTRCPKVQDICAVEKPVLSEVAPRHAVACHFPMEQEAVAAVTGAGSDQAPGTPSA
ncbi:MAG: ATP-binding cassette domain-containing protein [Actinomycetota bacterium]|nr:ATP-binding cassette domain-containing protein [Actinomycetota bacterium]MDH4353408.1 ATP-binding cassette domain-containing protein [Actinomycetota bacterium]MDH5277684.1 ATP-binding cassette domain-containing protein [Actinomycetota bacterium]